MSERIDGWEIVPEVKKDAPPKGYICGKCGNRFEHGKAYSFYCGNSPCPMGFGGISSGKLA